jgi:hypothetical protein
MKILMTNAIIPTILNYRDHFFLPSFFSAFAIVLIYKKKIGFSCAPTRDGHFAVWSFEKVCNVRDAGSSPA